MTDKEIRINMARYVRKLFRLREMIAAMDEEKLRRLSYPLMLGRFGRN